MSLNPKHVLPHVLALAYVVFLAFYFPLSSVIEYGPDEGFELIKSLMVTHGFSLYKEIWNDQPPLHTLLLASLFKLFGATASAARYLALAFTGVLLSSLALCLQLTAGTVYALAGLLLLIASPYFPELSLSAMLEMPTMAMGCLAMALFLIWLRRGKDFFCGFSALIFGLALQTKLTSVIFLPALVFALFQKETPVSRKRKILWLTVVSLVVALVYFLSGEQLEIFIRSHAGKVREPSFHFFDFFGKNKEVMIPLVLIFPLIFTARGFALKMYGILVATVFVCHFINRPFWYYYELHIYMAIALILPQLFYALSARLGRRRGTALAVAALFVLIGGWRLGKFLPELRRLERRVSISSSETLSKVREYKNATRWIYTDRPVFAFHAGLMMPPALAVVPKKRTSNGLISDEEIVSLLKDYRPEQILLFQKDEPLVLSLWLKEEYRLISKKGFPALHLRKDIAGP